MDQRLVGQTLARNAVHKAIQPGQGVALYIAVIQPKGELVHITANVLGAGVVIDANQAALHHGKDAFDAVGGHAVPDVLAFAVIDAFMGKEQAAHTLVGPMLVRVQRRADLNMLDNRVLNGLGVRVRQLKALGAPAALPHPQHGSLADSATASLEFVGFVLVLFLPADIDLINLHDALQLGQVGAAGFPQPMQDKPCRLLGDADFLGELQAGNTLAGRHQQVHDVQPFVQRDMAALENGARPDGEIFLALVATVEAARTGRDTLTKATARAFGPLGPQPTLKIEPGRFLIGKQLEKLERGNGAFGHLLFLDFCNPENGAGVEIGVTINKAQKCAPDMALMGDFAALKFAALVFLRDDKAGHNTLATVGVVNHGLFLRESARITQGAVKAIHVHNGLVPAIHIHNFKAAKILVEPRGFASSVEHFCKLEIRSHFAIVFALRVVAGEQLGFRVLEHVAVHGLTLPRFRDVAGVNRAFEPDGKVSGGLVGACKLTLSTIVEADFAALKPFDLKAAGQGVHTKGFILHGFYSAPGNPRRGLPLLYRPAGLGSQVYNSLSISHFLISRGLGIAGSMGALR